MRSIPKGENITYLATQKFALPVCAKGKGFPGSSVVKSPPSDAGNVGLIPELGRSPEEGNGYPLLYSCLEIPWTEKPGRLQSLGSQSRHD